jgi:hypothetical protein
MQKITPKQEEKPVVKQQAKKKGCGCGSRANVIFSRGSRPMPEPVARKQPTRVNKRNLNRQINREIKQRNILM